MNYSEACNILGVDQSASKDEINTRFRKISKEKHPDICKEPNSEEEYKKISSAYEFLKNYNPNKPQDNFDGMPFSPGKHSSGFGFNDAFFRDFIKNQTREAFEDNIFSNMPQDNGNIYKTINISFKDSVVGCEQKIVVDRKVRCASCGGRTKVKTQEACGKCGGSGRIEHNQRMGNQFMRTIVGCNECFQSGKVHKPCDTCNSTGQLDKTSEFTVRFPGGVRNGSVMTLNNAGNFIPFNNMFVQGNVLITVNVEENPNMWLGDEDDDSVYSKLNISLYEALAGTQKNVETIDGYYSVDVNPGIKHKDEIIIPKRGIRREADHRVVINIDYPESLDKLIEVLKSEK